MSDITSLRQTNAIFSHCRFCAAETYKDLLLDLSLENIFDKYMRVLSYIKLNIDFSLVNNLPKYVCLQCHNKCLDVVKFFLVVKKSQKKLAELYTHENHNETVSGNYNIEIKSEIIDESFTNRDLMTNPQLNTNVSLHDNILGGIIVSNPSSTHVTNESDNKDINKYTKGINLDLDALQIAYFGNIVTKTKSETNFESNIDYEETDNTQSNRINFQNDISMKLKTFINENLDTKPNSEIDTENHNTETAQNIAIKNEKAFENIDEIDMQSDAQFEERTIDNNTEMPELRVNKITTKTYKAKLKTKPPIKKAKRVCKTFYEKDKDNSSFEMGAFVNSAVSSKPAPWRCESDDDVENNVINGSKDVKHDFPMSSEPTPWRFSNNDSNLNTAMSTISALNIYYNSVIPVNKEVAKPSKNSPVVSIFDITEDISCLKVHKVTNPNRTKKADILSKEIYDSMKKRKRRINRYLSSDSEELDESIIDSEDVKKSWENYPWSCLHCKEDLSSMDSVREHSIYKHDMCYGFRCVDCDEEFNRFSTFVEHVRNHRKYLRLYCQFCNTKFKTKKECFEHSLTHWTTTEDICNLCGEIFQSKPDFTIHKSTYKQHKIKQIDEKINTVVKMSNYSWLNYKWRCLDCFKKFKFSFSLRMHMRKVHSKCFATKCADCLVVCDNFDSFIQHVIKHRRYLRNYCPLCNKYYKNYHYVKNHLKTHYTSDKPCYSCGEIFRSDELLLNHMRELNVPILKKYPPCIDSQSSNNKDKPCNNSNNKVKPCNNSYNKVKPCNNSNNKDKPNKKSKTEKNKYLCNICGKVFSNKRNHIKTHNKTAEEVCKICNKTFNSKALLKLHALTHILEKRYTCDFCQMKFKTKNLLRHHIYKHINYRPFQCKVCKKKFIDSTYLKNHLTIHTGQMPYMCEVCNRKFRKDGNCHRHMLRMHGVPFFKSVRTARRKLDIDKRTGKPKELCMDENAKQWLNDIMSINNE